METKPKTTELTVLNFGEIDIKKSKYFAEKKKSIKGVITKNKVIVITDNKSYEAGKVSRTAVRSLRTGLENEKKDVAKIIKETINEKVATEYDNLIEEVKKEEAKRQEGITTWEQKKEKEAEDKRIKEDQRKEKLTTYISTIKADLEKIIVSTDSFGKIDFNKKQFNSVVDISAEHILKGIDLEEFEVDYHDMISGRSEAFQTVITNLTTAHELEERNKALAISELTNERNNELFDYGFRYKGEIPLGEFELEEYAEIMVPERTKFRIKTIEELGFTKSVSNENLYIYSPNENVILSSIVLEVIKTVPDKVWEPLVNKSKFDIQAYEETPEAESKVEESEKVEEKKETPASPSGNFSGNITLKSKVEEVEAPLEFNGLDNPKLKNPISKLIEILRGRGFEESFIEETLAPVEREVREYIIDAYNDGQTDTIKIVLGELEKELPIEEVKEMAKEFSGNINKMDAVEYYNQKFEN